MSVLTKDSAFVDPSATAIGLDQIFGVSAAITNPTYLVLTALDRNEYTAGATGATGSFMGNGQALNLRSIGSDARGAGIVFTYQASTGRYYNSTYGYLDQLTYNSSGSAGDVTNLSLFGTNNLSQANAYASNAYAMMQVDAAGYLGSATIVTQPKFTGIVPTQTTPDSLVAVADGFVGQAWNMDGCWILTSTIAADAGASLPVQSTAVGLPGQANGEWIVAYNGPAGQTGNWQSMVKAGEMVVFQTGSGGGHITTCVSGTGSSAMLVDNITYVNSSGAIQNAANDGSSNDVIVAAPHIASQEWAGVSASSVVIYELDTPIVTDTVASDAIAANTSLGLGSLFTATDPANKAIVQWQVYDTAASDSLVMGGIVYHDHAATSALTTASLSSLSLLAGSTAAADTLEVRAYNGSYWGDWTSLGVAVSAPAPVVLSAPILASQTAAQTWLGGKAISLTLPSGTFTDPQNEALTYTATQTNGAALPSWLRFNAATETFTGTAPSTAQSLGIKVTATDTSGLATSETFTANVQVPAPKPVPVPGIRVSAPTPHQTWTDGQAAHLTLSPNTFTDALGLKMYFAAYEVSGPNITGWLHFNSSTDTISGFVPRTARGTVQLEVVAWDQKYMSAIDLFSVTLAPASGHVRSPANWGSVSAFHHDMATPSSMLAALHF